MSYGFAGRGRRAGPGDLRINYVYPKTKSKAYKPPIRYDLVRQGDGPTVATDVVLSKHRSYKAAKAAYNVQHTADLKAAAAKSSRGRHVFPTDEIPHLWAHKVQASARNSQGNLYFDGDTIYSYGSHFPIARHVTGAGRKGAPGVLLNERHYSPTTSGHQAAVKSAIPPGVATFEVRNLEAIGSATGADARQRQVGHVENLRYYQAKFTEECSKVAKVISAHAYKWRRGMAAATAAECRKYCQFFGLKAPKLGAVPTFTRKRLAHLAELDVRREAALKAYRDLPWDEKRRRRMEKDAAARAKWEAGAPERERLRLAEEAERGRLRLERVEKWKAGELVSVDARDADGEPLTLLRVIGAEVQTSRGARVPVEHARTRWHLG